MKNYNLGWTLRIVLCLLISAIACLTVPRVQAAAPQIYAGKIGDIACELGLIWYRDGSVRGILEFQGRTIVLRGENPREGVVNLFDSDGDVYRLRKSLTKELVIWSGAMNDTTKVHFVRLR